MMDFSFQELASLLPPRPKVDLPKGDAVEEVNLMPFEDHYAHDNGEFVDSVVAKSHRVSPFCRRWQARSV